MKWVWCFRFVSFISLAAFLLVPGHAEDAAHRTKSVAELFSQRVLELTNVERSKAGLQPLKLQANLRDSATWKAHDMAVHNYFSHEDADGRDFSDRICSFGYQAWRALGENIAAGQDTPEQVVDSWMHSPGHRKNILNPAFTEIGIGYALDSHSEYSVYWVQEFGTRVSSK